MKMENESNIPKKIHYVWLGNASKPRSVIDCINSWKEKMLIMKLNVGMRMYLM